MRKIIILALLLCSTIIVQAQSQIDSIKFIDTTTDSLVYIVHSSISSGVTSEYYVECEKETDNVNINILYLEAFPHADCYCPVQTTIKIEKDIYLKAIVSIKVRHAIGGTRENPIYSDKYVLIDSKEVDLATNVTNVFNSTILNKFSIFPNPVRNVFYTNLEENKTANLEIYNLQGSLLLSKNIISEEKIDVSFLSSGMYFVFIDRKSIGRIIKE